MGSMPNGHISVDSPSIKRRNFPWNVRQGFINFERQIHVEIITSIPRETFYVDLRRPALKNICKRLFERFPT